MDQERHEVYERIPWETLDKQGGDRQWVVIAVAGAVVAGALAYTFVKSQPATPAPVPTAPVVVADAPPPVLAATVTTVATAPVLLTEADLYAVDPQSLLDQARAHAEWFAVEYFSVDGSEESKRTLATLMPAGLPLPDAPEGTQVFVDWVGTRSVTETGPLSYDVSVLVRSLVSIGDGAFVRQAPRLATIGVTVGETGQVHITGPPMVELPVADPTPAMGLAQLPPDVRAQLESAYGMVLGGAPTADGRWAAVVVVEGIDGVRRPVTVLAP